MARRRRDGRAVRDARGVATLESYREFMDDWDAFQEAIRTPEPTTLRTNVLRISRDDLKDRLEAQGFQLSEVPHQPAFLRVEDGPRAVSDTLEHWLGLFYIQQTATGWAAPLLDPQPGEVVLDLCSAPGGKTTHVAELVGPTGAVVASDVNESRIRALLGNVYRLGHTNVLTVAGDGRRFPLGATFDRVMVDVPCSAEGTLRKRGGTIPGHSPKFAKQVARAQEKIVRRAVELTRPGGILLYVTCTFGPHENEAVLTRLLEDAPVDVEPLDLPVPHAKGLTGFQDHVYDPRMAGAVRLYPHHLDSGGLFICRLKRLPVDGEVEGPVRGWVPVPEQFPDDEGGPVDVPALLEVGESFAQGQLGIEPEALKAFHWLKRGSHIWAHDLEEWPYPNWEENGGWRMVALGLRALDLSGKGPPRPSNDLLGRVDDAITKGRVELTADAWLSLMEDGTIEVEGPDGLVALCWGDEVLARGFRRDGVIRHEVPKGRFNWLRNVMKGIAAGGS